MSKVMNAAILLAIVALMLLWARGVKAEELTPLQALARAQELGKAPAWIDWRDSFRMVREGRNMLLCVEDRDGPGRFAFHGDLLRLIEWRDTGRVNTDPASWQPTPVELLRLCWPDL